MLLVLCTKSLFKGAWRDPPKNKCLYWFSDILIKLCSASDDDWKYTELIATYQWATSFLDCHQSWYVLLHWLSRNPFMVIMLPDLRARMVEHDHIPFHLTRPSSCASMAMSCDEAVSLWLDPESLLLSISSSRVRFVSWSHETYELGITVIFSGRTGEDSTFHIYSQNESAKVCPLTRVNWPQRKDFNPLSWMNEFLASSTWYRQ